MDLRKLRDHPDSEVAQFKKWSKKWDKRINTPKFLILFCICGIFCSFAFAFVWFCTHQKPEESIKIYKAIEPPIPRGHEREKMPANGSTEGRTDTDSSPETPTNSTQTEGILIKENLRTERENETPASTTQSKSEISTGSEQRADKQKEAGDEEARKVAERLKAKKADVDQILAEGDAALAQARNTVNQTAPILQYLRQIMKY